MRVIFYLFWTLTTGEMARNRLVASAESQYGDHMEGSAWCEIWKEL